MFRFGKAITVLVSTGCLETTSRRLDCAPVATYKPFHSLPKWLQKLQCSYKATKMHDEWAIVAAVDIPAQLPNNGMSTQHDIDRNASHRLSLRYNNTIRCTYVISNAIFKLRNEAHLWGHKLVMSSSAVLTELDSFFPVTEWLIYGTITSLYRFYKSVDNADLWVFECIWKQHLVSYK